MGSRTGRIEEKEQKRNYREKNKRKWKRRIKGDIKKLRQGINLLT